MSPLEQHPQLQQMIRVLRLIIWMFAAGVMVMLCIGAWPYFFAGGAESATRAGPLTSTALALGGFVLLAVSVVRAGMIKAAFEDWSQGDVAGFQQKYARAVLLATASLGGAGLFLGIAFLLERDPMTLTAGLFCILVLLAALPSPARLDAMLDMRA